MIKKEIPFSVAIYASAKELNEGDRNLLARAKAITEKGICALLAF